jgi:pimeloyl-ACP methyl ester carboxylesterase
MPANSFPVASYAPLFGPLTGRYRVISAELPGLALGAGPPPPIPASWADLGEQFAATIAEHDLSGVIAVGHSFGAVVSLVAAARHPDRFSGLCLLDPTMVSEAQLEEIFFRDGRGLRQHRLAVQARERRTEFASEEEAFGAWRSKRLFHDWSDDLLRGFVSAALRPNGNGSLTLAWPAAWEASYYEGFYPASWKELGRLPPRIPVLVARGRDTEVFTAEGVARFRALRPTARLVDVPGYGHLFPLAAPGETSRLVEEWLDTIDWYRAEGGA